MPTRPLVPHHSVRLAPARSRSGVLVVLLLLTLVLAATLAYEAHDATRSHRATAERALRDYTDFAAWELHAGVKDDLDAVLGAALGPLTEGKALSPYEPLASPAALARSASSALPCEHPAGDSARFFFRLDLRDGALITIGASPVAATRAWVAETVAAHARTTYQPAWRYAILLGAPARENRSLVYGVKYAGFGAPIAAFGFATCPSAFGVPLFREIVRRHPLLPSSVTRGLPNDSLLSLTVYDAAGHTLYRSPETSTSSAAYAADVPLEMLGGITARVALRPAAAERFPVGRLPGSRLPLLVGLLALTAALVVIALLQLHRESELARLRADFTSSVSHELRTPLSQILLFAETLSLGRVRSEREGRGAADVIVQEARRLMHLVENVLFFARAEHGANHVTPRAIALAPLLREVAASFGPLARQDDTDVVAVVEDAPVALADPDALRQILLNLLDNAVKYGSPGQTVTVGAEAAGARVRVWVEDQGPGIPPGDRERIWHPFVRLPRDRNTAVVGSGIGLAVVRDLATLQGGSVSVGDGAAGGARFTIELPAAERVRGERATAGSEPRGGPPTGTLPVSPPRDGTDPTRPSAKRRPPAATRPSRRAR